MLTAEQKGVIRSEIDEAYDRIAGNLEILINDIAIIDAYEAALNEDAVIRPRLMAVRPEPDVKGERGCAIQLVSSTRAKPSL